MANTSRLNSLLEKGILPKDEREFRKVLQTLDAASYEEAMRVYLRLVNVPNRANPQRYQDKR
jgi:hypothetical protein